MVYSQRLSSKITPGPFETPFFVLSFGHTSDFLNSSYFVLSCVVVHCWWLPPWAYIILGDWRSVQLLSCKGDDVYLILLPPFPPYFNCDCSICSTSSYLFQRCFCFCFCFALLLQSFCYPFALLLLSPFAILLLSFCFHLLLSLCSPLALLLLSFCSIWRVLGTV